MYRAFLGATFALFIKTIFMDKSQQNGQHTGNNKDSAAGKEHSDMPIKTTSTDSTKNTARENGLNPARNTNNNLEPGTSRDPDFTETD